MSIQRLSPKETRKRIGDPFSWSCVILSERYSSQTWPDGEAYYWNESDLDALPETVGQFIKRMKVQELLGTIVAPEEVIYVNPSDEEVVHLDPREEKRWLHCHRLSIKNFRKDRLAGVKALFEEVKIKTRFRGGISASGHECPRLAELLAVYAIDLWCDVLLVSLDQPLAVLVCHEGDLHMHARDEGVLTRGVAEMKKLGLKESPGLVRPTPDD